MNPLFVPQNIKIIYDTFINKKKERFDIIMDPLQAIIQISLLRFCPQGTKITINNNILELQLPTYTQGIIRWYNNDNKDDIFYLFNVCKRFGKIYGFLKQFEEKFIDNETGETKTTNLYDILIESAKDGFNKLLQTYSSVDKVSLLHTINMYKMLLDNTNIFDNNNEDNNLENNNMENVFSNIKTNYSNELYKIIHNTLHLLIQNPNNNYINGLNNILNTTNFTIREWINKNIIF